ncbi:MAG TPA: aminoglycoside 6-adenylyltransferase [Candidatus Izemoplasmatales bacterium]|nr:aminoglycoside 6-adenylyltransferase [Candidatus Izemoplasmatales bacterium]
MNKHQRLYKRVIDYAKTTQVIRLVEMNGSRVNSNVQSDDYQDFDIVYYVDNYESFNKEKDWVERFGEILIMQTKDDQIPNPDDRDKWYIYLIQFKNGTRLDLTIQDINDFEDKQRDSLSEIILDKDNLSQPRPSNESSYYVAKPNGKDFSVCVNEFYWVCPYIAKGLARHQFIYAVKHLSIIRSQYEKLLDWWIGYQYNFEISVGKGKSRYIDLLPDIYYQTYINSYVGVDFDEILKATIQLMDMFDRLAQILAKDMHFTHDNQKKNNVKNYILKLIKK